MIKYFKPTARKILGVIILLFLFSFISFFLQYIADASRYASGETISIGFPLLYFSLGENDVTKSFNIINLIIDIIIFYFITCILAIIFKRRKENVPNSNSGGRDTSPANQTQS